MANREALRELQTRLASRLQAAHAKAYRLLGWQCGLAARTFCYHSDSQVNASSRLPAGALLKSGLGRTQCAW